MKKLWIFSCIIMFIIMIFLKEDVYGKGHTPKFHRPHGPAVITIVQPSMYEILNPLTDEEAAKKDAEKWQIINQFHAEILIKGEKPSDPLENYQYPSTTGVEHFDPAVFAMARIGTGLLLIAVAILLAAILPTTVRTIQNLKKLHKNPNALQPRKLPKTLKRKDVTEYQQR